jgi:hypothetical protein
MTIYRNAPNSASGNQGRYTTMRTAILKNLGILMLCMSMLMGLFLSADASSEVILSASPTGSSRYFEPKVGPMDAPVRYAAGQPKLYGAVDNSLTKLQVWGEVEIDIKPGSRLNTISLGSNALVPMAILSSPDFYATAQVDAASIRLDRGAVLLDGNGEALCRSKDTNRDGFSDLVCLMQVNQSEQSIGEAVATMTAKSKDGDTLTGQDVVRFLPHGMGVGGMRGLLLH